MPRWRAGQVERWEGMIQELVDIVIVDEIMDHDHGRAMTELHPVGEEGGELFTSVACQESASRLNTTSRRRFR